MLHITCARWGEYVRKFVHNWNDYRTNSLFGLCHLRKYNYSLLSNISTQNMRSIFWHSIRAICDDGAPQTQLCHAKRAKQRPNGARNADQQVWPAERPKSEAKLARQRISAQFRFLYGALVSGFDVKFVCILPFFFISMHWAPGPKMRHKSFRCGSQGERRPRVFFSHLALNSYDLGGPVPPGLFDQTTVVKVLCIFLSLFCVCVLLVHSFVE